ncbi:large subunit ribosomal protein L7A [Keratinibaculum paraultunense]|uniref:Large subunit ribosomal protein L7A n=1 Tax=Keratinibaculum paraultunense TaxID=1278232 RepID=A0A4R3KP69_9FIRM|nr:ribosomal L7Ae/L30e/S12e/Gadd45 family protein [Keratinibaculum paraultunense]QQY79420.1 ribosomal L7Ae/L30e/S12e/Gadd45 family protein [Keratinibaculum paraultunense]TCS85972.1 large subunit ribosomal protein L7A [Keratinibaculum paraultunense]
MLDKLNTNNKVVGTKQVKRALSNGDAEIVYVAKDADKRIVEDIIKACEEKEVELVYVSSMKELGKACKIDVSAASAALLK